jgi:hypothetical protein
MDVGVDQPRQQHLVLGPLDDLGVGSSAVGDRLHRDDRAVPHHDLALRDPVHGDH